MALAILMIAFILIQQSDSSAGGAFGGADNWNAGYHTRRGSEKFIFNTTMIFGVLFGLSSLLNIIIK